MAVVDCSSKGVGPEEVDRFFGCLKDMGESLPIPAAAAPEATSPFTKGFFDGVDEEEDEMLPFVVPAETGRDILSGARMWRNDGIYSTQNQHLPHHDSVLDAGSRKFWISVEITWSRER